MSLLEMSLLENKPDKDSIEVKNIVSELRSTTNKLTAVARQHNTGVSEIARNNATSTRIRTALSSVFAEQIAFLTPTVNTSTSTKVVLALACKLGAQIGLAVGSTFATFILLALCCLLEPKSLDTFSKSVQTRPKPSHPTLSHDLEKLTERPLEISYSSIVSATSNFNNVLGEGGFGVVYSGLVTGSHCC
ncbi:hypothetical protein L7F22_058714 [Adiantum nelumboides]|nr:hypothetical protein [Adiantum nelumboides]